NSPAGQSYLRFSTSLQVAEPVTYLEQRLPAYLAIFSSRGCAIPRSSRLRVIAFLFLLGGLLLMLKWEVPAATGPYPRLRVLLTGFRPFGGARANVSEDLAADFRGQTIAGVEITTEVLPVQWGTSRARIADALRRAEGDGSTVVAVVGLGQTSRKKIKLE